MTDANITVANVQQYKANVELLMQQKVSLLADKVTTDSYKAKAASHVEQFGQATAIQKVSRNSDTPNLTISQDKRWVYPLDYEWATMIDQQDVLRMIIDPQSPYAMAGAASMNRAKDDVILAAFFGTSFTGENGTTAETFNTTNFQVGVNVGGTASSINVAKLQSAMQKFLQFNLGELDEELYAAISSLEHDALLKEVQVNNQDYGGSAVLVDGKVKRFMGFNFVITERITGTLGVNRNIPTWRKSGMHLGYWEDVRTEVTKRADKSYATQVYLAMTIGACRLQAGKIIQIVC